MPGKVRLCRYNPSGSLISESVFSCDTKREAIVTAVLDGFRTCKAFLVVEPEGEPIAGYWTAYEVNWERDRDLTAEQIGAIIDDQEAQGRFAL